LGVQRAGAHRHVSSGHGQAWDRGAEEGSPSSRSATQAQRALRPNRAPHANRAGEPHAAPASPTAFLRLDAVSRSFGATVALQDLSLHVRHGEFVSILGPSGSGKSTTLNLIAGFDFPSSGEIHLDGRDVTWEPSHSRGIGMVFQNYALFPHMTVFENVAFPLRSRRQPSAMVKAAVDAALQLVQLESMVDRLPRQLSGGQQQRVALARAIVYRPAVLLMDEPLGALDRKLRADMQVEIKRLHRELGTTVLYVTHDQEEALSMSDRIAVLHRGRLEQFAPPQEIYARPATRFVAGFVGEVNFLPATIDADGRTALVHDLEVRVPLAANGPLAPGTRVTVSLRPEHLALAPHDGSSGQGAIVVETLYLGDAVKCVLRLGDTRLVAKVPLRRYTPAEPGDAFALEVDITACQLFID